MSSCVLQIAVAVVSWRKRLKLYLQACWREEMMDMPATRDGKGLAGRQSKEEQAGI